MRRRQLLRSGFPFQRARSNSRRREPPLATRAAALVSCASMPLPRELPIYELEDAVVASLRAQGRLIVQAPTGSGKSTQIPQMLLRHGFLDGGEVVVLQPRRLAARMLA